MATGITLGAGITMGSGLGLGPTPVLKMSLDAGDPASYPGAGGYSTWSDTIGSIMFTLVNGPTYNSANGGYIQFDPGSGQYGATFTSLPTLSTWTVEAWHYYDGTNSAGSPCIVTEVFPGTTSTINYALGSLNDNTPNLQSGFYSGGWTGTPPGYTLTSGNWYQIVGTYDGTNSSLFVNNTLVAQAKGSNTPISSTGGILLMRRWDYGQYWGGKLGIVKIYEGAMNSIIVSQNWNLNKARFGL